MSTDTIGAFDDQNEAIAAYEEALNAALEAASEQASEIANEAAGEAIDEALTEAEEQAWAEQQDAIDEMLDEWVAAYEAAVQAAIDAAKAIAAAEGKPWYCMEDMPPIQIPEIVVVPDPELPDINELYAEFYSEAYQSAYDSLTAQVNEDIDLTEYLNCVDSDDWGNMDFVGHYFSGNGEAVNLGDIGLEDTVRESDPYTNAIAEYANTLEDAIKAYITANNIGPNSSGPVPDIPFDEVPDFTGVVFSLGSSPMTGSFVGTFTTDDDGNFTWEGSLDVDLRDRFEDPADIFDWFNGNWELPGADPYDINGDWEEPMGGSCP